MVYSIIVIKQKWKLYRLKRSVYLLFYIQFQTENKYHMLNVFKKGIGNIFHICFIGHTGVVRKLHIHRLVYIVVGEPFYILALVPFGILDVGFVDTFVVRPACTLAWGFVDNFDVAQFGSSVAGLDCIAGEELSDTLV